MKKFLLLTLGVMAAVAAQADTRMMLFSDPHVLASSLYDTATTSFKNAKASDPKLIERSEALFDSAIQIVLAEQPDLFLLPGDMTRDGELVSHEYVHAGLQQLVDAGIQVLVVPGNHDLYNKDARSYLTAQAAQVPTVTAQQFDSIYSDCGFAAAVMRDTLADGTLTLNYMAYPTNRLAVICLNSCQDNTPTTHYSAGGLDQATLSWMEKAAAKAKADGHTPIAMLHHPVVEHFDGHVSAGPTYIINEDAAYPARSEAQARLAAAGIRVCLTGHFHIHSVKYTITTAGDTLYDINTGSLSCLASPIRTLDLSDQGELTLSTQVIDTYFDEALPKNQTVARGAIAKAAARIYPMMSEIKGHSSLKMFVSAFDFPTDEADLASDLAVYMLEPYTAMYNALATGDEPLNPIGVGEADALKTACVKALDDYMLGFCKNMQMAYTALRIVLSTNESYQSNKAQMDAMINSVFGNYVTLGGQQVSVEDWGPEMALPMTEPTPTALTPEGRTTAARKVLHEGRILLLTPGQRFGVDGRRE